MTLSKSESKLREATYERFQHFSSYNGVSELVLDAYIYSGLIWPIESDILAIDGYIL
jgi:hypothetical protein